MTDKTYAGVGSRQTPTLVLELIQHVAVLLEAAGYTLRSGGANGADSAFASATSESEIYLPWDGFNSHDSGHDYDSARAHATVPMFHPIPEGLSQGAAKLMARNAAIIFGEGIRKETKVDFLICWAKGSKFADNGRICDCDGGTGQAVRMAYAYEIPVFNLFLPEHRRNLLVFIKQLLKQEPTLEEAASKPAAREGGKPAEFGDSIEI